MTLKTALYLLLALALAFAWWLDQQINGLGAGEVIEE